MNSCNFRVHRKKRKKYIQLLKQKLRIKGQLQKSKSWPVDKNGDRIWRTLRTLRAIPLHQSLLYVLLSVYALSKISYTLVYFIFAPLFRSFSITLVFMSSQATLLAILILSLLFVHFNHLSHFGSVCLQLVSHTTSSVMYVMPLILSPALEGDVNNTSSTTHHNHSRFTNSCLPENRQSVSKHQMSPLIINTNS